MFIKCRFLLTFRVQTPQACSWHCCHISCYDTARQIRHFSLPGIKQEKLQSKLVGRQHSGCQTEYSTTRQKVLLLELQPTQKWSSKTTIFYVKSKIKLSILRFVIRYGKRYYGYQHGSLRLWAEALADSRELGAFAARIDSGVWVEGKFWSNHLFETYLTLIFPVFEYDIKKKNYYFLLISEHPKGIEVPGETSCISSTCLPFYVDFCLYFFFFSVVIIY